MIATIIIEPWLFILIVFVSSSTFVAVVTLVLWPRLDSKESPADAEDDTIDFDECPFFDDTDAYKDN